MGTGLIFLILVFLLLPLGLGMVIGYFMGKSRSAGTTAEPRQEALARAWQEGYDAANAATGQAQPRRHSEQAPPQAATPTQPASPVLPPRPQVRQPTRPQPQSTPAPPDGFGVAPATAPHMPRPDQAAHAQHVATAAAFQPKVLTPEEVAAKRERDQIRNANILLYVAALLMVGTGMLFVAAGFPAAVTISALAIVTIGFYGAGLLLHKTSARLRSSGTAFSGTGLALYPILSLSAATQLWPGSPWPWLVFSIIGTIAFTIAAAVLNSRVVAFLTLPFLLSIGVSAGAVLRSGMVWSFVFTILIATIISWFAAERPRWLNNIFINAFVTTHEYIVPATLVAQAFLFTKMTDLQNTLVFGAGLLYYVTRTALGAQKHKLYFFTAARALFLLTLWQVLRTFNVAGSTIATIMAVAISATIIVVLIGQQRYATLLKKSERTERFAANWLRADLGVHALALVSLTLGTESTIDPNMFGKGDWAVLNLPLVITMITFAVVILLHQRYASPSWWGKNLDSPLWFLAAPFWLARSGDSNYGAEFFRPEVFWILGFIGFGVVFLKRRHHAVPQLALAAIGGTVLYLVARTHMGVLDTDQSWQTTTVVVALWLLLAVMWLYAVAKLARWGAVQPALSPVGTNMSPDSSTAPIADPTLLQRVSQRFRLSHRLVGYTAAAVTAILLWSSLSAGHANAVSAPAQQQSLYYLSIALVLAIVISFGLILLRNLRRAPETTSTHIALWGWALVSLTLGIRERLFLNRLDADSTNWFSLVFGLVLVTVVWLAGYFTAKRTTESAAIQARWYQTAAILGLGYALFHGLSLLNVNANLLFGIPFAATLGYFVFQAVRDSNLTAASIPATTQANQPTGNQGRAVSNRYRRHALISAGLLLIMPLFLLIEADSLFGDLSHRELYRWLVFTGWILFTVVVLWYALRRVFAYLPVAAIGVFGALSVATIRSAWAGESEPNPYLSHNAGGWVSITLGLVFVLLMIAPNMRASIRQRWGSAGIWAPILAHLILSYSAIDLNNSGYIWALAGLGLAGGMILASHREQVWLMRPLAVPVIFLSMIAFADELRWDLIRNTESDIPVWLGAGFLAGAISYLIGLFYTGGDNGKHAARMTRLTALGGFLIFMLYGWTDTKAPLVFAVILTLVALIGLGLEQRGGVRRTFLEITLIAAVVGAQRIWADVPGNDVDQRIGFWFQQHVVLALIGLAVWTYLRQRQALPSPPAGPLPAQHVPAHQFPGHQDPALPQPQAGYPLPQQHTVAALPPAQPRNTRFNVYLYSGVTLLTIASTWLFGLENSGIEFFYTIAAFVAVIVYGAMRSRTGMLIWGIVGTILVLFLFLNVGSFLLLFLLALALMGVGIWQLVRISKKPVAAGVPGQTDVQPTHNQDPYNQPGAYGQSPYQPGRRGHPGTQDSGPTQPPHQPPQAPPTN